MKLTFSVNGVEREVDCDPLRRLLDVLREDLKLVGTKEGCGEGECGACTVLVGKEAVNSCLIPVCQVEGLSITTIEGLADADPHHGALALAFAEHGASQCGICTPGMIVMTRAYLDTCKRQGIAVTEDGARTALAGNLCRCTGYGSILAAALAAAAATKP